MITIIDYGAGNIGSVQRACAEVGVRTVVVDTPADIQKAERIIFPGVGAAPPAMDTLKQKGSGAALKQSFAAGVPILGICIGAQVILDSSEEGKTPCLGLIPGKTVRFKLQDKSLKIPHMGWNAVKTVQPHPLLEGVGKEDEFYFVHSYYPQPDNRGNIYAVTDYGGEFCSALGYKNLFAVQFHPEKSGRPGLQMLERFVKWDGRVPSNSTDNRSR
ncbi:MAG: imidazole glycerol phosphate synthase subunit HisH [Dehalococcoidales bacterium]|nr:imidazole glycerol phosphate synthase subunit HisH [Dehalococcoidales bacterium]